MGCEMGMLILQIILWGWFLGCICTYRPGGRLLVEGMGIKSAEFFMLCLYTAGGLLFWLLPAVGKWVLPAVLLFWAVVQFLCHWYYTIFGASEKKLAGYNRCFKDTIHLFPASETRLIPDLYHIVLHLLILTNLVLCIANIIRT